MVLSLKQQKQRRREAVVPNNNTAAHYLGSLTTRYDTVIVAVVIWPSLPSVPGSSRASSPHKANSEPRQTKQDKTMPAIISFSC